VFQGTPHQTAFLETVKHHAQKHMTQKHYAMNNSWLKSNKQQC